LKFNEEEGPEETRSSLLQRKKEMLHLTEEIFSNALGMADSEAWLHHYMLGKIAEKLRKSPQVYLEHYATVRQATLRCKNCWDICVFYTCLPTHATFMLASTLWGSLPPSIVFCQSRFVMVE